jgi:hypothetical protein
VRFHELIEVKVHRHRKRGRAGWDIEYLPGANIAKAAGFFHQGKTGPAFKSYQFGVPRNIRFEDNRRAGDGHRDEAGADGAAAGILWHAQEN